MEKPEIAPNAVGRIMADCWKHNPEDRKTFNELEHLLGQLVDENTRQCYTNNEPKGSYIELNCQTTNDSHDYLEMSSQAEEDFEINQQQSTSYEQVRVDSYLQIGVYSVEH